MNTQTPCSDYVETSGIIFFARMLDKVRLNAQGLLPAGYNLGFSDPTSFDARFCRFWDVDCDLSPLKLPLIGFPPAFFSPFSASQWQVGDASSPYFLSVSVLCPAEAERASVPGPGIGLCLAPVSFEREPL